MPRPNRCAWSIWRRGRERLFVRLGMERGLAARLAEAETKQRSTMALLLGDRLAMDGELAVSPDGRIIIDYWPSYR